MSDQPTPGSITWRDLTVSNAEEVAEFYAAVAGWKIEPTPMGEYDDYSMMNANGECVAGVCHARGPNAGLPPQWLNYITVEDVEASAATVVARGGEILEGPRSVGDGTVCVIKDPAGAVAALYAE